MNTQLRPEMAASLDAWIASQPDPKPSRPEAVRRILILHLNAADAMIDDEKVDVDGVWDIDHPPPTGPATDVVEMMDAAINDHRKKRKK